MRFHGILLTRDDEDIIGQCIAHALTWCDALHIYDTGSTDKTWEIVHDWALKDQRVKPLKKENPAVIMTSGTRGYVFSMVRDQAKRGDWFAQVDSDEFYHILPPAFLRERVKTGDSCVYVTTIEFRITDEECKRWAAGDGSVFDRSRPISELRRHYVILPNTEPRMFRYRPSMQWTPFVSYPYNMGFVAMERIPVRHYPHRDPYQLQRRLIIRNLLLPMAERNWTHWEPRDWHSFVMQAGDPQLCYWKHDTALPDIRRYDHVRRWPIRSLQRLIHSPVLPLLDTRRPRTPIDYRPPVIPAEVNEEIVRELAAARQGQRLATSKGLFTPDGTNRL